MDETISTLRFASTTKNIKNKPVVNEDSKDALLRRFQEQVKELRDQLAQEEDTLGEETSEFWFLCIIYVEIQTYFLGKSTRKVIPPELIEKLQALEAKICVGGENLIEKAEKQEKMIAESEKELETRRLKAEQLQRKYEQRQAEMLQMEDSYASLQDEVSALNKKLRKAYGFLKQARSELDDLNVEHEKLRSNLLDSIRNAEKEIKLTNGLIGYYIPQNELKMIENNSTYNQMTGEWELRCVAYTGNNIKVSVSIHLQ